MWSATLSAWVDTSPRSYQVRREIRKGFIDLLQNLHSSKYGRGSQRYQRIIIVAHSLGGYIAYDGISHLWSTMNIRASKDAKGAPRGLKELEEAAARLPSFDCDKEPAPGDVDAFQHAQYQLWSGLRAQGNPWRITDFITVGTPMYFADLLYTKNRQAFNQRVQRRELPTCPPQNDERLAGGTPCTLPCFSFMWSGRQVLYDGAPFAFVRWTNLWFPWVPQRLGILGDWFGGPLRPLFGKGIRDIPISGNKPKRLLPAFPMPSTSGSPTTGERAP